MNVLVPVTENDGELLVPSNVVGSRGPVVGMDDEGSSKTVDVLSCEREEGEEASSDRGEESGVAKLSLSSRRARKARKVRVCKRTKVRSLRGDWRLHLLPDLERSLQPPPPTSLRTETYQHSENGSSRSLAVGR